MEARGRGRAQSWLRRVDDAVFAVEQGIVVTFLSAMAVMVFLDVVHRQLTSQGSKLGMIMGKLLSIDDPATQAFLDASVAPYVGIGAGLTLLWFGYWTADRHRGKPLLPIRHGTVLLAAVTAGALAFVGWLMVALESRVFVLLLYGVGVAAYLVHLWRTRPARWQVRAGSLVLVVTPLFGAFVWTMVPLGYTWSQELSLMLLLWIGFLGASVCVHEGKHLRVEAADRIIPPKLAKWVRAASALIAAAFCAFMALLGYRYVFGETGMFHIGGGSAQMGIPDWLSSVAVPIAFAGTCIRFVAVAVSSLVGQRYGEPTKHDTVMPPPATTEHDSKQAEA